MERLEQNPGKAIALSGGFPHIPNWPTREAHVIDARLGNREL
jgi:hypothetical protein